VESDLPKGYRGAAERSSNVGVPEWLYKGYRGGAERSSNVGVPAFPAGVACPPFKQGARKVGVPETLQAMWVSQRSRE
jgi:hypothetical protein